MANLIRKEVTFESSIAAIGAAMSDISRVKILSALMDGRAWTATELSFLWRIYQLQRRAVIYLNY